MPNKIELSDYFRECMEVISKNEPLRLNVEKVSVIIVNDLGISFKNVPKAMICILCECFCYYMQVWPGWKEYYNKCLSMEATQKCHAEFKDYLRLKLQFIIKHSGSFLSEDKQRGSVKFGVDDTKELSKPEAPYTVVIQGQPYFLNNIFFLERNDDVVITQYPGRSISCININQLLNYPSVKVTVQLLDMEFSRSNSHKFTRYITDNRDNIACPENKFIEYVEKISHQADVKVYALDYIIAYYKEIIKVGKKLRVDRNKLYEIETACRQFVRDIQESNVETHLMETGEFVNTMATNTTVSFNIGGKVYFRNKKMTQSTSTNKSEEKPIHFCEILIPQMVFSLTTFTAEEDLTASTTCFKRLNYLESQANMLERRQYHKFLSSAIKYECLCCSMVFIGERAYGKVAEHFTVMHKGEQDVICFKCRKEFIMPYLAGGRWNHDCDQVLRREKNTN